MPNRLIDTVVDSDDDNNTATGVRIKRQKRHQNTFATPPDQIYASDLLELADKNSTTAKIIISDDSVNKIDSFKMLSKTSAVAKSVLRDIENDKNDVRLDTLRATNVLRFFSNLYDNQL
ncbi:p12 [Orgyia leucostigma nucleopolyhedrovirus]|uniref:p12 n=1 Tax=Orgyia leucostigma nucleopolyhedrovirus TaxID=490711 RepID=B0FDV7_9ABAC|nr:p12 [Orgyia leucostigma nucleopolyhedrovirus]ABY65815.1 p12 [Orgyia leucostigma nucleopolyhedrovirus]